LGVTRVVQRTSASGAVFVSVAIYDVEYVAQW